MQFENTYLECQCTYPKHRLVLIHDKNEDLLANSTELYLSYMLEDYPFWYRLINGLKYIFNGKLSFQETLFDKETAIKFRSVLNEFIDNTNPS